MPFFIFLYSFPPFLETGCESDHAQLKIMSIENDCSTQKANPAKKNNGKNMFY